MAMPMAMRCTRRDRHIVRMLVMLVMGMSVLMLQRLMGMAMAMALSQVQPNPDGHQGPCLPKLMPVSRPRCTPTMSQALTALTIRPRRISRRP